MGDMTSFARMRGGTAEGYYSRTGDAKAPAIVVIQEWWGLQGQIKAVCDRLALAGFTTLAPDLYGGKVVPYHDEGAASAYRHWRSLRAQRKPVDYRHDRNAGHLHGGARY